MSHVQALIDRYLATWNETDEGRRRTLVRETFTEDATYLDPLLEAQGHDRIDAMIAAAQAQFSGHTFRRVGVVDSYGERVRFSWALGSEAAPERVMGSDFGVLHEGRLRDITGFLDRVPAVIEEG